MSDANLLNLSLDRKLDMPLFQQIYEDLKLRILHGKLDVGYRLPPTRAFANELGVSRSSVVTAYDQLLAEGYIESKTGSGYFVCDLPELKHTQIKSDHNYSLPKKKKQQKRVKAFMPGVPDMGLFPHQTWARCIARVARDHPVSLIEESDPFGNFDLRKAICSHLREWRGIDARPEQVVITAGALGALEIITDVLTKKENIIALENPGYRTFRNYIERRGYQALWLEVDEQGAILPELNRVKKPQVMILTPSHQFPLGGTMSMARRTEFLNYAIANKCWIVEDDFDSEFRYSGRPIPALASMDKAGCVFYVGSFSKIFSSNLRLGYLVLPYKSIGLFEKHMDKIGSIASITAQSPLAEFINCGEFHKHMRKMRRIYSQRRKAFIQELMGLSEFLHFEDFPAGMQVAAFLNNKKNDVEISKAVLKKGVIVHPLSEYYVKFPRHGLLMGFCAFSETDMKKSFRKLRAVLSEKE